MDGQHLLVYFNYYFMKYPYRRSQGFAPILAVIIIAIIGAGAAGYVFRDKLPFGHSAQMAGIAGGYVSTGLEWSSISPMDTSWADAGKYCANLKENNAGWSLPSTDEISNELKNTSSDKAIQSNNGSYWSNNEAGSDNAYIVSSDSSLSVDAARISSDKSSLHKVICVRSKTTA
jgi:hypothetical protein